MASALNLYKFLGYLGEKHRVSTALQNRHFDGRFVYFYQL